MAFPKATVTFDKGACSMAGMPSTTLKDVYMHSIDHVGVMVGTHSDPSKSTPMFFPMRFIASVDFDAPLPQPKPQLVPSVIGMPKMGPRQ